MGRGVFFAAMSINESASLDKPYGGKMQKNMAFSFPPRAFLHRAFQISEPS